MIKAIVMDMDGTLLNEKNEISPFTQEVLMKAQKMGIRLVLASGRSYTRLMPYAKKLQMEQHGGLLLEVDGIAEYDLAKDCRHKFKMMQPHEIQGIFDWFIACQNCEPMACFDDGLFDYFPPSLLPVKEALRKERGVSEDHPWTAGPWSWLEDLRNGYPHISYVKKASQIDRDVNKLQIMAEEADIPLLFETAVKEFGSRFEIFRTTPRQLEVLPKGFSKGKTLQRMMKEHGWHEDEVLAFGDGENDVSLFEAVEHSYAMQNAQPFVQEQARHVTKKSNREDGIAHTLLEVLEIEEK